MGKTWFRRVVSSCVVVAFALLGSRFTLRAQEEPRALFDWSMPDRFGLDERSLDGSRAPDGLLDYSITFDECAGEHENGCPWIHPASWRVDFDASGSTGGIATYRWSVDGQTVHEAATPRYSHSFPDEGTYSVTLDAVDGAGNVASTTRRVVVQDWLIVGLGDSYASGEGNPELPIPESDWNDVLAAYAALGAAQQDLQSALDDLASAEFELTVTLAEITPALNALNTWNRECPSLSLACASATATLTLELGRLGLSQVPQIIDRGYSYIRSVVNGLADAARAVVDGARATVSLAQAEVDRLSDVVTERLSVITGTWQTIPERAGEERESKCHRTSRSGQAQAALRIEQDDPRTSVTFVQLACSGAQVDTYENALIDTAHSQLVDLKRLVGDREIDALVVSIGGNDVGFATIVLSLVATEDEVCGSLGPLAPLCRQKVNGTVVDDPVGFFESKLALLPGKYEALGARLGSLFGELPGPRVYLTAYPNLVENDAGQVCPDFLSVTHEEWQWIGESMTVELNAAIEDATALEGWTYIGETYDGFHDHGYCADDHWVIRAEQTFAIQGDQSGAAHPTAAGHTEYADQIRAALIHDFYPQGSLDSPRPPGAPGPVFLRADSNADGRVDISDGLHVLNFLFLGGPSPVCSDAADTDDDGTINISDAIGLFGYLFLGGKPPSAPGPEACGTDPTEDSLGCDALDACRP